MRRQSFRRSDEAIAECVRTTLTPALPDEQLASAVETILADAEHAVMGGVPAHRALPDAMAERARWLASCSAARSLAEARTKQG